MMQKKFYGAQNTAQAVVNQFVTVSLAQCDLVCSASGFDECLPLFRSFCPIRLAAVARCAKHEIGEANPIAGPETSRQIARFFPSHRFDQINMAAANRGKRKSSAIIDDKESEPNKLPAPLNPIETILSGRRLWLNAAVSAASQHLVAVKPLGSIVALYAIEYNPEICQKCAVESMYFGGHCRSCGSATQSRLHVAVWDSVRVSEDEFKKWKVRWPRLPVVRPTVAEARETDLLRLGAMFGECKRFNRYLTDHQLRIVFKHAVPNTDQNRSTESAKSLVSLICFGFLIANTDPCWNGDIVEGCTAMQATQTLTDQYKAMSHRELKLLVSQGPMALANRLAAALASASASASASAL
jgi:hypothetical protein